MNTENAFEFNGVRYVAIPSEYTCKGCEFEFVANCPAMNDFFCDKELRKDRQNVIFKRAAACQNETKPNENEA